MACKPSIDFVIRVKRKFNDEVDKFIDSGQKDAAVVLTPASTTLRKLRHLYGKSAESYRVRLLRSSDDVVVMTSLLDNKTIVSDILPASAETGGISPVEGVYRNRWTDETTIGFLKNNLEIEIFSTTRAHVMYQDFYSKLINYNIVTLLAKAADERQPRRKEPKHRLGINRNIALGALAIWFWKSLILNNLKDSLPELLRQIGRNTCPIIDDRHNIRVFRKIKTYGKYITLPNYRQALLRA